MLSNIGIPGLILILVIASHHIWASQTTWNW